MISPRSRYAQGVRAWVDHPVQGRVEVVHLMPAIWNRYPFVEHTTKGFESFDLIAFNTYGDPTAWWFVAEMNPGVVHPEDLVAGTPLLVPLERTL